eukprot:CAMPEP_0197494554 /NCGR_PEP_ID=MMETSP1311-20131121/30797_1 /TAXON_ID=464262 /ORGANISM="Genus nov. species nov., Strain RCC856" /LENGTH=98 /DNA_ID=CAMNT_0043039959 /DNA_START=86 /DNA_END=382 /DNA_ORIENTATION=+
MREEVVDESPSPSPCVLARVSQATAASTVERNANGNPSKSLSPSLSPSKRPRQTSLVIRLKASGFSLSGSGQDEFFVVGGKKKKGVRERLKKKLGIKV